MHFAVHSLRSLQCTASIIHGKGQHAPDYLLFFSLLVNSPIEIVCDIFFHTFIAFGLRSINTLRSERLHGPDPFLIKGPTYRRDDNITSNAVRNIRAFLRK